MSRNLALPFRAMQHLVASPASAQCCHPAGPPPAPVAPRQTRPINHAQRLQLGQTAETGQRKDLIALGVASNDIKVLNPIRPSPQHGNLLQMAHEGAPTRHHSNGKDRDRRSQAVDAIQHAAVTRQQIAAVSLTPAWRLNMLSQITATEISTTNAVPANPTPGWQTTSRR